ncbi:MAG: hypothetical protein R3B40_09980 [Polyangiales bacterium]|nr:hypothetical protein [Myxococcales bacterium]MCB9657908.1 hypothetical protein [Sandaracinaceae bacterium]
MAKLFFLMFVWGPAMLGFSLGWLVVHPDDWTGPAVVGPLGAIITLATYRAGLTRYRTASDRLRPYYVIGMTAGALMGVALFVMLAGGFIG